MQSPSIVAGSRLRVAPVGERTRGFQLVSLTPHSQRATVSPQTLFIAAGTTFRKFHLSAPSTRLSRSRSLTTPASSVSKALEQATTMEVATVGGGCFWCIEACYNMLKGVKSATSGYAGGHVVNPTYKQVCNADTGHAEVVQVMYDPAIVSYEEILEILFTLHDPTTKDRQGNDVGPQYRSIIMYHNDKQREAAQAVMERVSREQWWPAPLTTELVPLEVFYPAEDYHQQYFVQNPGQGYCRVVVGPKVAKFRSKFASKLK